MPKRIRKAQNKGDCYDIGLDDRLSRFSDDILAFILSRMPPKDSAVTSKLSRRWRHVWCHTTCLNFEDKEVLSKIDDHPKLCWPERNNYINQVNRVIRQHKSPTIKEFKIRMDLNKNSKRAVNNWIEFALSKNVQTLELDLRSYEGIICHGEQSYVFPNYIFGKKSGNLVEIKRLKTLILKGVNVNDEGLSKIMSSCVVLEHLSIHMSYHLVNVKIHGETLALKHLEMRFCSGLESVEICDSNIVSFTCVGVPVTLRFDNLPKLEKITLCEEYLLKKDNMFDQIFCCFSYLQVLQLDMLYTVFIPFPELPKVKQLILNVAALQDENLLVFTPLLEACPNLLRFTIQLSWWMVDRKSREVMHVKAKLPHQHLEVVEIGGYHGWTSDVELAMYFLENGVALKKLVIDPRDRDPDRKSRFPENVILEHENRVRCWAQRRLKPRTPAGVDLVIL